MIEINAAQRLLAAVHPSKDPNALKKYGFDPSDPDTKKMANAYEYMMFDSGMPSPSFGKPASANWLKQQRMFIREAKRLGFNPDDPKFIKKMEAYGNASARSKHR